MLLFEFQRYSWFSDGSSESSTLGNGSADSYTHQHMYIGICHDLKEHHLIQISRPPRFSWSAASSCQKQTSQTLRLKTCFKSETHIPPYMNIWSCSTDSRQRETARRPSSVWDRPLVIEIGWQTPLVQSYCLRTLYPARLLRVSQLYFRYVHLYQPLICERRVKRVQMCTQPVFNSCRAAYAAPTVIRLFQICGTE